MRIGSAFIVAFTLTTIAEVHAQSRVWFAPAVVLNVTHDSNLFLGPGSAGDTLTHVRPVFEGAYESPSKEIHGAASFEGQVSAQYPALTALGARRNAVIDGRVYTTPRMSIGGAGRYDRTDSPSELISESGVLFGRQIARRTQITPSAAYRLKPRTMVMAQYDWTGESLSGHAEQSLHAARVGMDYTRSARTQWGGRYISRAFVSSPFNTEYSYTLLLAWTRQLAPGSNVSMQVGPRVSSYRGISSEVLASFLRQRPRERFLLDYWHGETIVLGVPGPVEIHSATNRISWLVRNDLEVSTLVGVFGSESTDSLRATVYHGGIGSAWTFRDGFTLTAAYRLDFQHGDLRRFLPPDGDVRRGVLMAGLNIAPRLPRSFRPPDRDPSLPMTGVMWP